VARAPAARSGKLDNGPPGIEGGGDAPAPTLAGVAGDSDGERLRETPPMPVTMMPAGPIVRSRGCSRRHRGGWERSILVRGLWGT